MCINGLVKCGKCFYQLMVIDKQCVRWNILHNIIYLLGKPIKSQVKLINIYFFHACTMVFFTLVKCLQDKYFYVNISICCIFAWRSFLCLIIFKNNNYTLKLIWPFNKLSYLFDSFIFVYIFSVYMKLCF